MPFDLFYYSDEEWENKTFLIIKEVVVDGKGMPWAAEVERSNWIKALKVKDVLSVQILSKDLGPGESEAIVLAQELKADYVVIDEEARDYAKRLGLKVIGTLGILLWAKKLKKISNLKSIVEELINSGFRIKEKVYGKIIEEY